MNETLRPRKLFSSGLFALTSTKKGSLLYAKNVYLSAFLVAFVIKVTQELRNGRSEVTVAPARVRARAPPLKVEKVFSKSMPQSFAVFHQELLQMYKHHNEIEIP